MTDKIQVVNLTTYPINETSVQNDAQNTVNTQNAELHSVEENEFVMLQLEEENNPPQNEAVFTILPPEPVLEGEAAPVTAAESTTVSDTALKGIMGFEGCKLTAYKDTSGVLTIGVGHTKGVKAGQTITEEQAMKYLKEDLADAVKQVNNAAEKAGVQLTQGQFDALVSFTFNLGEDNLNKSGLLQLIKDGNLKGAEDKMKQYVNSGGKVQKGLVNRRAEEAKWLYA